jgi:hypothetical protein
MSLVLDASFAQPHSTFSTEGMLWGPILRQYSMIDLIEFGFAKERLGLFTDTPYENLLMAWIELFIRAPYFAFCRNICLIGSYPVEVHFDEYMQLRNLDGRAMTFSDGFAAAKREL